MSRKRSLMPDVYRSRKRICVAAQPDDAINSAWDGSEDSGIGTYTNWIIS